MHSHPSYMTYVVGPRKTKFMLPDGRTSVDDESRLHTSHMEAVLRWLATTYAALSASDLISYFCSGCLLFHS
jgi:hypothetical protein